MGVTQNVEILSFIRFIYVRWCAYQLNINVFNRRLPFAHAPAENQLFA